MAYDILVLGAGMVGVSTAIALIQRGHAVTLMDRKPPGAETSFGNAGIIQREAVLPHPFPRDWTTVFNVMLKRGMDVNYHFSALPHVLPSLARYWAASHPDRYARIVRQYSSLIAHSLSEHEPLIEASGAQQLIKKTGYRWAFHTEAAMQSVVEKAQFVEREYGVQHVVESGADLQRAEPLIHSPLHGAVRWQDPWTVSDPGHLVTLYAALFERLGGRIQVGDALALEQDRLGWRVPTQNGWAYGEHAVVALGPWSDPLIRRWGYRLPLFVKRGYHQHYQPHDNQNQPTPLKPTLNAPLLVAERGFVLAPMAQGIRLTTGAEFARLGDPATPIQLRQTESAAREFFDLGSAVPDQPWLGHRPCTPDMKPVIGAAGWHKNLWFNFGHAHHGFALGPASGRLLADLMEGSAPYIDPMPFSALRKF